MKDVEVTSCVFNDYIWQNDHRVETKMVGEEHEQATDSKETIPREIADPDWLDREKNNVVEAIRRARDIRFREPDHTSEKIHGWRAYARAAEEAPTDLHLSECDKAAVDTAIKSAKSIPDNGPNVAAIIKEWHALAAEK